VGGWGALAGVLLLGPRLGKYKDGKVYPILGHNMPLATIGVFLLWLGWFGFNGGSVLSANPGLTSLVLVTTSLAAAAGGLGAALTSWIVIKKPDLSMALNGVLAGLVGITAGADQMSPLSAIIIGLLAGIIVVFSVLFLDKLKIDDPVGAISVHLVCGIFGTLAVGIWGNLAGGAQLVSQLKGIVSIGLFTFICAYGLFFILKKTIGIRVPDNAICRELLGILDQPILSTTLILPGDDLPLTDPYEMRGLLDHQVDLIIDGGFCGLEATTVVDMTGETPLVTRTGKGDPSLFEE
jgi:Amt family ammonium transporter